MERKYLYLVMTEDNHPVKGFYSEKDAKQYVANNNASRRNQRLKIGMVAT